MASPLFRNFFGRNKAQNDPGQQGDAQSQRARGNLAKGAARSGLERQVRAAAEKALGLFAKLMGKEVIDKAVTEELDKAERFLQQHRERQVARAPRGVTQLAPLPLEAHALRMLSDMDTLWVK